MTFYIYLADKVFRSDQFWACVLKNALCIKTQDIYGTIMVQSFWTDRFGANSQIRVYTVYYSVCISWSHYCMVKQHCPIKDDLSMLMRLWYLSHRWPAKAQASLRICAVLPEPSLFAHMKYRSRRRVQPKIRHLAPLDGCACAFEEWVYGGRKAP